MSPLAGALKPSHGADARRESEEPPRRHVVVGARGGQGTTTVALALATLAAEERATTFVAHDPATACAAAGCFLPDGPDSDVQLAPGLVLRPTADTATGTVVDDAGHIGDSYRDLDRCADAWRWLVLRGPCYLSLRQAVRIRWRPHGIVLLAEPKRALDRADVVQLLGTPVVAEIPIDPDVARAVDAGTLLSGTSRLRSLRSLKRLVDPGLHGTYLEAAS